MSEGRSSRGKESDDFLVQIDEKLTWFDSRESVQPLDLPDGKLHIGGSVRLCRIGPKVGPNVEMDPIEMVKYKYLKLFLERRNETSVKRYFMAMIELLERAIECYDIIDLGLCIESAHKIPEMMVVDSCFIVEFFCKYERWTRKEDDDPTEEDDVIFSGGLYDPLVIVCDLFSPRNQLPFFVVLEFFNMAKIQYVPPDDLIDLALNVFGSMVGCTLKASNSIRERNIKHLVNLVYDCLCLPLADESKKLLPRGEGRELRPIYSATELQEAGVSFKRNNGKTLVEIDFEHGVLRIPPLKLSENTLILLNNLIEYESQFPVSHPRYVSEYVKFMQRLVNSTKDVEVLRQSGVIENLLGNDEMILKRISNMNSSTVLSGNVTYWRVLLAVNEHRNHSRNVWMAKLWSNYFNSPWSLVSFIAAVVLLLLTLTQTLFAILSYHPS